MTDDPDAYFEGSTGDEAGVTQHDRAWAYTHKTPALVTCAEPRCIHSILTWHADLPARMFQGTRGAAWPKCPERHRVKIIDVLRD
jgi:hypothetical protein